MKNFALNWLSEKVVFFIILLVSVFLLFTVKFYPSMDGPSHLYNANLLIHLVKWDANVLNDYFIINRFPIPNWTSYIILVFFKSFLPAWCAEKILLLFYIVGLSLSFRAFVKQLCPGNIGLSIFIFPFAYSFLFHLGFYNYCISFVFLFLALAYWLKYKEEHSFRKYLLLFVFVTLTYFSAILSFMFLGFCIGLFVVAFSINTGRDTRQAGRKLVSELLILLLVSLPALIFAAIFVKSITFFPSNECYTTGELVKWLNDVRCLIVYDYVGEGKFTGQFLHILIAMIAISLFLRFYRKERLFVKPNAKCQFFRSRKSDVLVIPVILSLVLLFIVPNGSNAGMMSDRFCLLAYLFFMAWGISQPLPKRIMPVFMVLIIIFHLGLLFKRHNGTIRGLDRDAQLICNVSGYIAENSIVLPVNMSDNWLEPHFSNYLGVDKPMVILENYEASVGWFPVCWNMAKMPRLKLGDYVTVNGVRWISNSASSVVKQVDYVFLYGNVSKINDPNWAELKTALDKYYTLTFVPGNHYVCLYKAKGLSEKSLFSTQRRNGAKKNY